MDTEEAAAAAGPVDAGDALRDSLAAHIADPKGAVVMLAVGSKGSGKTHFCLRFLRHALESGAIDKLFLIAPTAKFEASDSYAWADPKRVFIFTQYVPVLTHMLLHRRDKGEEVSRVALFVDDMAAADGQLLWRDDNFSALVAIARHVRVNIVLAHHAVTGGHCLPTFLRQNLSHTLLTRIASKKLLEQVYEEWLGLNKAWTSFRSFASWFCRLTDAGAGPGTGLLVDVAGKQPGSLSWSVKTWWPECAPDVPPGGVKKTTTTTTAPKKDDTSSTSSSSSSSDEDEDDRRKRQRRTGPTQVLAKAVA